jgi:signal transduction histidine kinase
MGLFNLNMFTYFPSSLLALWGVRRFRLADIRSIAYPNIFYQNQNGMLIIDQQGYLVDFNAAAEKYLAISNHLRPGEQFNASKLKLPSLPKPEASNKSIFSRIEVQGIPLQVEVSALVDPQDHFYAYLVSVQDITSQTEAEKLKEAEIIRQEVWSERTRLARNLHDSTLQNIGSLILLSGSLSESLGDQQPEEAVSLLEYLNTGARLAYEDLRTLIKELHMDDSPAEGFHLINALEAKVHLLNQQYANRISIRTALDFPLDAQYQRELYYIIMEALNNALKHTDAKAISIILNSNHEFLSAEIVDNGGGFDVHHPPKKGMGLENMHSRAAMINGNLSITSLPTQGTTVRVELPLDSKSTPL